MKRLLPVVALIVAVVVLAWATNWFSAGQPNTPPSASPTDARQRLSELAVKPAGSMAGYSRDRFPHWATVEGRCDTRETVLKRDGVDVKTDAECRAVSGSWTSPYDGETWTKASDIDIDHWVPLAAAWRSGAAEWTDERRKEFANDLTNPQLIAVTDNVNQSKGDQSPDQWKPPLKTYWCTYAANWIEIKHRYGLSITAPEKAALLEMLAECAPTR
ncbi:HNH endonuclease family protein [Actinokineospora iranica]|uniref:GmrSD restriction endonucleases C-terminal domain-containing protein n=1 Tax=Actinokineospora iranica TaxID=1271860 RepID=A0A1G6ZE35_9PSEU|nr:HNH endonuclease family protein [Actinokineospora iranica]SDE00889.1 Protein of unknown function [Actinokineospora iranica]